MPENMKTEKKYEPKLETADWRRIKISDVCIIIGGGTPKRENPSYFGGDYLWLTPTEIDKTVILTVRNSKETITEAGLRSSSAKLIPQGAVLLTSRATIGNVAIAGKELTTNQGFASFLCGSELYNKYLAFWLKSVKDQLIAKARGTTFKEIAKAELKEFEIPLPPLPIQQAIVARLEALFSELDKGIEQLKTARQQLRTYRQAVLKAAFEGRLTGELVKEGELPEGWKWIKMGEVASAIDPQPSHRTPPVDENGIPYVGIGEIDKTTGTIDFENARKVPCSVLDEHIARYPLIEGDFIIGKIGTIGKPFKVPTKRFYALSANVVLVQANRDKATSSYLFYLCQSNLIEKQFQSGSKATTQAAFGIKKVRDLEIPICGITEQENIVSEIESRLSVADKMEETIAQGLQQAEALRQSILKKAFKGGLNSEHLKNL